MRRTPRLFRFGAKAQPRGCRNQMAFRLVSPLLTARRSAATDPDRSEPDWHFAEVASYLFRRGQFGQLRFHFLTGPERAHFDRSDTHSGNLVNFFDRPALQVK